MIRVCTLMLLFAAVAASSSVARGQMPGPTKEHEKLKKYVGKWDFVLKTSEGTESKGASDFKLECGGLWVTSDFKTDFAGMPFQGKGLDGFDPAKKKYISVWVDSLTPAPMFFEGDYDVTGKVLTMTSNAAGPDGKPAMWRSVSKLISDDEHTFEMFLTPKDGKEMSMMLVTYKRSKN
jgi:hypothetical protein